LHEINGFLEKSYLPFIHYDNKNKNNMDKALGWVRIASGNPLSVTIDEKLCESVVYYGDHVTRMQSLQNECSEKLHKFTIPKWNSTNYQSQNINKIFGNHKHMHIDFNNVLKNKSDSKIYRQKLLGFDYKYLENDEKGSNVIKLKLPEKMEKDFKIRVFNMDKAGNFQTTINTLHLPIKLSTNVAKKLNTDGRCLENGDQFDDSTLYIPEQVAQSQDVLDLIYYTIQLENEIDPDRLRNNMILLTLRVNELQPNESLGQTGWHIDGHQGAERIQMDGNKMPIDRVYAISNTLSTQATDMRLNLDPVRERAKKDKLTLDQYNLQDIIHKSVIESERKANLENKTIIATVGSNELFYANPYMLHQSDSKKL
jgi:hypothetical protein